MNKTGFIKLLAQKIDTSAINADKSLKIIFETIEDAIAKEDSLVFVRFGTFKTTISKARKVKNAKRRYCRYF